MFKTTTHHSPPEPGRRAGRGASPAAAPRACAFACGLAVAAGAALTACSHSAYRERADREVYRIVEQVREGELGSAEPLSIDTAYASRKPADITSGEILEERGRGGSLRLTLAEALEVATENSRTYQSRKEQLYLTALNYTGTRHRYRFNPFAGSTVTHAWQPDGRAEPGTDRRLSANSSAGVGLLLKGGADLGVTITNNLLRFTTGAPREADSSSISADFFQPLLRGAGGGVAAEQLTQSFRNVVYEVRDFSHFQNEFSTGIVVDYFRLLQQKDTIFNEYNNYQSRLKATVRLRARAADRERPLDVKQAEQAELPARSRYIDAIVRYRDSLDRFKIQLGIPVSTRLRLDDADMDALKEAGLVPLDVTSDQAFALALEHRLPLMNEIDRFEDSQRMVTVAADGLEPGIDLFGGATLPSRGPVDYKDFDVDDLSADVGLAIDLPVNRKPERNAYRAALISFESQVRSLGETFDQLRTTLDQRLRELQQTREDFIIQQNSVELARARVNGAELNLQAGNAVFRDLEEAQDALIAAQNGVTAARVDYMEARLRFFVELGVLDRAADAYWLSAVASKVDLTPDPGSPARDAFLRGEGVIPPEELFRD